MMNGTFDIPGMDEYRANKAALDAAAKLAAEWAEAQAKEQAQTAALIKRRAEWKEFYGKINARLTFKAKSLGYVTLFDPDNAESVDQVLQIMDPKLGQAIAVARYIDISPIYERVSSWRVGKVIGAAMTVGYGYGRDAVKWRYRQLKTGEWKWDEIADNLLSIAQRQFSTKAAEQRRAGNATLVAAWQKAHQLTSYSAFQASSDPDKPLVVQFSINRTMTFEQAEKALKFMEEMGVYVSREKE